MCLHLFGKWPITIYYSSPQYDLLFCMTCGIKEDPTTSFLGVIWFPFNSSLFQFYLSISMCVHTFYFRIFPFLTSSPLHVLSPNVSPSPNVLCSVHNKRPLALLYILVISCFLSFIQDAFHENLMFIILPPYFFFCLYEQEPPKISARSSHESACATKPSKPVLKHSPGTHSSMSSMTCDRFTCFSSIFFRVSS